MSSSRSRAEIEEAAAVFVALNQRPLTMDEALDFGMLGWNIRCNQCGSYGAEWLTDQRPGWGALAVCPTHRDQVRAELRRHEEEMRRLRTIHFEQELPHVTQGRYAAYQKRRAADAKAERERTRAQRAAAKKTPAKKTTAADR